MAALMLTRRAAAMRPAAAVAAAGVSTTSATAAAAAATGGAAVEALPSFARALFRGEFQSAAVAPYPEAFATEEARSAMAQLVDPTEKFFANVNKPMENDEKSAIPAHVVAGLKDLGAFGLQVPEELGGIGLNNAGYARMVEIVGGNDLGCGIFLGSHQSIGYKGIMLYGTEAQKAKYLPALAAGDKIAAFALTEPGAGSDAASVKTRATLSADGKHYVINGAKIWISNGNIADVLTVFARMEVVDAATGEKRDKMGAFIVERAFGGVTSGAPEKKMGIRCSPTAEVYFDNVHVPVENLLGKAGDGFKVAMGILNNGRFGMGAALTGTQKWLLAAIADHVNSRVQFGRKLRDFGAIKGKVATMASRAYATESLAYLLALNMDRGSTDYQLEAAASKVFASESAWYAADEAIQIMGGLGFMTKLPFERIQRDLRIFRIFEGANGILRQMIGLTGLQSLGKDLEPLRAAAKAPLANLGVLLPFAVKEVKARLGFFDTPSLAWAPAPLRPAAAIIEDATGRFGDAARRLLMKYGKGIVEQQLLVEATADVVIDITVATAALSRAARAHAANSPTAAHEIALASLFAEEAKGRIADNLRAMTGGHKTMNTLRYQVADQVMDAGKYIAKHPLGV